MFKGKLVKIGDSGGDESCNVDLGIIHGHGPRRDCSEGPHVSIKERPAADPKEVSYFRHGRKDKNEGRKPKVEILRGGRGTHWK